MKGRTSFIIAHRLSTIRKADKIIVIDKGHVVESGSHQQLMQSNGLYRRLNDLQFEVESELL
jgi:ABC-type multidrug transport system fused ATPase/permease subunit